MRIISALALGLSLLVAGCGGSSSLGANADFSVRLTRTDGSQDLTGYEMYLTRNGGTTLDLFNSEAYASTQNRPSWSDAWTGSRSTTELRVDFRSRSDQPPYFLWVQVPNTTSQFETLQLVVWINGQAGAAKRYNLTINATERIQAVRINRDSAEY